MTVNEVAATLARAMDVPHLAPEVTGKARTGDIRHCFGDIGEAARVLGFQPKRDFAASMGAVVEWVRRQRAVDRVSEASAELERRGLVA